MDEPACPGCRELLQRVAELEAQVAELTRRLDDALRAGKRQAAPFRKGPPTPDPKTPGRKSGAAHGTHGHRPPPPPEQVAECHEADLPDACPHCRGRLVETGTADQFQTDIPRKPLIRKFHVHVGHCQACGKRTQGRHPLQTSDALGAAASQVGPDAQAAAAVLHTQMGLSHGKVASVFRTLFGITLTRGASAQIEGNGVRVSLRVHLPCQAERTLPMAFVRLGAEARQQTSEQCPLSGPQLRSPGELLLLQVFLDFLCGEPRLLALHANELGADGLAVLVEPIGVDEPRGVIVRLGDDAREERLLVAHDDG